MRAHLIRLSAVALVLLMVGALPAHGQTDVLTGVLTGRVTDATTGGAVAGATVAAVLDGASRNASVETDADGQFRLADLRPGTYAVTAGMLGYAETRLDGISVAPGETARLEIRLAPAALRLPEISAVSRKIEASLTAPASTQVVGSEDLAERPTVTMVDHLRSVPGVDQISYGRWGTNIVTRGFNNLFSGALYTLTDYRIAAVPSLRVNLLHLEHATNEDLERMEVVLGPGAALYGPNTANGVLHILTRSPLDHQGTHASVTAGTGDTFLGSFRTAHRPGESIGLKLSGQYASGTEWQFIDPVEQIAREAADADPAGCRALWLAGGVAGDEAEGRCTRVGIRDFRLERWAMDARADWRPADEWTAVASAGLTRSSGIELTGLGAAQASGWTKYYGQTRLSRGRFFGQLYLNGSDAGDTFLLQNGASIVDRSKLFVAQLQHGFALGGRQEFTYGVDYLRTMPETEGTINGAREDDDLLTELGAYVQSETALAPRLDLVLAGRADRHSALDDVVFSPRAALVLKPSPRHSVRATYNTAFETPSSLNLFLDIHGGAAPNTTLAALGYNMRAQGPGTGGIDLVGDDGLPLGMRSPFNPGGAGQLLPAQSTALWPIAVGVLRAQGVIDDETAADFLALDASGVGIAALNPNTLGLSALGDAGLSDVPAITESRQTTLELGYKGMLLGDRVLLAADAWFTRKSDFISPLFSQTPFLLLDGPSTVQMLVPYFMGRGMSQEQATAAAVQLVQNDPDITGDGIAEIPLAVASAPDVNAVGADMLVSYRNFGEVELWGADLAAEFLLTSSWKLGLSGSWVSDDHFRVPLEGGSEQVVALNAPRVKGRASLGYRDVASGFNAEARVRYHNAFPANSAGYVGLACVGVAGSPACVDDALLTDLTLGYRVPGIRGATLQLTVQNLFDTPYQGFVRVPVTRRMALLRLAYEF